MKNKHTFYVPHTKWGVENLYYISHWLWIRGLRPLALVIKYLNTLLFRAYIDPQATIGARLDLPHGGFGVVIGPKASIGDDAIIFHNVTVGSARPGPVRIGDRVCIGTAAIILGPVVIGNDVKIGANAVVNEDVPDGATVVGPRARAVMHSCADVS